MIDLIADKLPELEALCREFGVRKLEVFGSAATGEFDPDTSDIDLLIEFEKGTALTFAPLFGLQEAAAALFEPDVDVVMNAKFRNPYFQEAVDESRELLYESASRQVAV
jgi:predicted nucleotidyltransferase